MMSTTTTATNRTSEVKVSKQRIMEIVEQASSMKEARENVKKEYNLTISNVKAIFEQMNIKKPKNQVYQFVEENNQEGE